MLNARLPCDSSQGYNGRPVTEFVKILFAMIVRMFQPHVPTVAAVRTVGGQCMIFNSSSRCLFETPVRCPLLKIGER